MPYQHWDVIKPSKVVLNSVGIDPKLYSPKELRHTTGSIMNLMGNEWENGWNLIIMITRSFFNTLTSLKNAGVAQW